MIDPERRKERRAVFFRAHINSSLESLSLQSEFGSVCRSALISSLLSISLSRSLPVVICRRCRGHDQNSADDVLLLAYFVCRKVTAWWCHLSHTFSLFFSLSQTQNQHRIRRLSTAAAPLCQMQITALIKHVLLT